MCNFENTCNQHSFREVLCIILLSDVSILKVKDSKMRDAGIKNCAFGPRCFLRIIGNLMIYVKETRKSGEI